jgi:hypothetical protein
VLAHQALPGRVMQGTQDGCPRVKLVPEAHRPCSPMCLPSCNLSSGQYCLLVSIIAHKMKLNSRENVLKSEGLRLSKRDDCVHL